MSLSPGSRLGPYEIAAPLGAGGMGEVFRARDARLNRDVAIKVLPAAFGQDAERLARFRREAQVLAALNHPNVAAIYGLEEGDGIVALVLELVEGDELGDRLKNGAVPIDEAIATAKQIADGLEAAHGKGIVHRDLKPANIKIAKDGTVKILDFGLAKAYEGNPEAASGAGLSRSPTMSHQMTEAGLILGTAAYMSPEQARGKAVDKRADIWSFGVVLWEMLAGAQLFSGETVTDVLAAVVTRDPDWSLLPAAVPASLRTLLRRCLDRDPKRRLHDIADARIVLEEIASGRGDLDAGAATTPVAPTPRLAKSWLVVSLSAAVVAGAGAGWLLRRPPAAALPDSRIALALPEGLTLSSAEFPQLAISRDGRLQVAVAVDANAVPRLVLRSDDAFEARVLPDTERAASPFFSPGGDWIGFFRDNAMYKIAVSGGPPSHLADTTSQPRGGTWSRDGFVYFAASNNVGLSRVRENGGAVEPVTRPDESRNERTHRWPEALPDGSAILFTVDELGSTEYYDDARIEAVRPATGERKVLVEGASQARYSPSGHLIFARGGALFAVRFDARSLSTQGGPLMVAGSVATDVSSGAVDFSLSEEGSALWAPGGSSSSFRPLWVDRQGAETSAGIAAVPYNELALSPDGKKVALVGGQGGNSDLWIADLERGLLTRLTTGQFTASPVFTPDGSRIAFSRTPKDAHADMAEIAWIPADGSREAEVLVSGERGRHPNDFFADGRTLLFDASDPALNRRDIWALPLNEERKPRLVLGGSAMNRKAAISPDGRWLAYVSDESGENVVYVRPYPSGDGRWQISTSQGTEPRFSRDGQEIFYRVDGALYAVRIDTAHGFKSGRPERLFGRVAMGGIVNTYGVAPDGRKFFTFRSSEGVGTLRRLYLDLGFSRRLAALESGKRGP